MIEQSFTNKTKSGNNYEMFEFIGDRIVNTVIS